MYQIKPGDEDGVDYININHKGTTELGNLLAIGYGMKPPFHTVIGKVGSIRSALEFIRTPAYPGNILAKRDLKKSDVDYVSALPTRKITEYWAIVAIVVVDRVFSDAKVMELLRESDKKIPLTAYRLSTGDGFTSYIQDVNLESYIKILEYIRKELGTKSKAEIKDGICKEMEVASSDYYKDTHFVVVS